MTSFTSETEFYERYKDRIGNLKTQFEGYIATISKKSIRNYLCQFELGHKPVALKMLEKIDYYSNDRTSQLTKQLGGKLKKVTNSTFENVYFCPTKSSSGSSTDVVIRKLRNFMGMNASRYDEKFVYVTNLEKFAIGPESKIANLKEDIMRIKSLPDEEISDRKRDAQTHDIELQITSLEKESRIASRKTIIFVDDYIGSGESFRKLWAEIGSYYNENNDYILACLVAHQQGVSAIRSDTPVKIVTATKPVLASDKVFHSKNKKFTIDEKNILKSYCDKMGLLQEHRYGFRDTQSLVIMYEGAANNVLPILYHKNNNWSPLFPRTL